MLTQAEGTGEGGEWRPCFVFFFPQVGPSFHLACKKSRQHEIKVGTWEGRSKLTPHVTAKR